MKNKMPKTNIKYVMVAVMLGSFLTAFMGSAINLSLTAIAEEYKANAYMLGWVMTSYILASAAFAVPLGRVADIIGRKKIFRLGVCLFALSSVLCGLAWSIEVFLMFRVLQGIGSAMIFSTAMAILTSVFPPEERGKILGINVATVYIGLSLGPVLGGTITYNLNWRYVFYLTAIISVVVFIAQLRIQGEWTGAKGESLDVIGAILYLVGLTTFMYGFSSISQHPSAKYLLAFGLLLILSFIRHETRIKEPILNLGLFTKNTTFALSNLAALLNFSATFALGFLLSLHLQVVLCYNSQVAGFIMLLQPVIMAILSPFAGTLSDKIQPRVVASIGMALTAIGLFMFHFLTADTPLWFILFNLVLMGTGFALFSSPNGNAIMSSVEKKYYGIASSTIATMRLIGQTISMAMVTMILAHFVGSVELELASPDLLLQGTKTAFLIFSVVCFLGIFASYARGDVIRNNSATESA